MQPDSDTVDDVTPAPAGEAAAQPSAGLSAAGSAPAGDVTDAHHDWVADTLGVDPRDYAGGVGPGRNASGGDEEGKSGGVFDTLAGLAGKVADVVEDTAKSVVKTAGEVIQTVETVTESVVDGMVDTAKSVVKTVEDTAEKAYAAVKEAIAGPPDLPPDVPKARADKAMKVLPPDDQKKVQAIIDAAGSEGEKRYLTKALAAGHSAAEIEDFEKKIAGKDDKWLNDNLRLVGDSNGKGIMQQWSYSCGPTTVEAIKGELDPIYALKVREANPDFESADDADATKKNAGIAEDQRKMLADGGGTPTSRDDPEGKGSGLVFSQLLNKQTPDTGLTFDTKRIGKDVTIDDALKTMDDGIKAGVPVPITVGDAASPFAHAALVTAIDEGPPRSFTIHDPYYGKTDTFTEEQIRNDQVNVGGWHHVGVVFPPKLQR